MAALPSSIQARRVLVDSSAYLALLDGSDEHHAQAQAILRQLTQRGSRHYTTNAMLFECHALVMSSLGVGSALQFVQGIRASNTVIVRVRQSDEERAIQILGQYTDKDFSFNDALSFVVMERLGISTSFTFDHHFAQYGLAVLQADRP
jgi:predicted nucleic acid-binding protein